MEQRKDILTVGIATLALTLILRFALLPFDGKTALSLFLYLQTGRFISYSTATQPPTTPTLPPVVDTVSPSPLSITVSAKDGEKVQLNNLTDKEPNIQQLLLSPLKWNLKSDQPTVLIVHTHATESYTKQPWELYEEESDYRTLNSGYNMLSVGEELAKLLEEQGIGVLHDRTLHDYPSYSGSYNHARQSIAKYLEAYPSICMVIDLHRDALNFSQDPQLTTAATVDGISSAQLMVVAGTDQNVSYDGWQENLALGVKLTAVLEKMHPGITRPIQLRAQRFNLDMTPGSLLIEVGANGNTHSEALVATRALSEAICAMAQGVNLQNAPPA